MLQSEWKYRKFPASAVIKNFYYLREIEFTFAGVANFYVSAARKLCFEALEIIFIFSLS
jgi:hypothetical protein